MALLNQEITEHVKKELADLPGPVQLVMFTQESACEYCAPVHQLVEEIAALSDQVTAQVYDFVADKEQADRFGVDKVPAIAVVGAEDYGVRFYGLPSGYEFVSLLEAIKTVAAGQPQLEAATLDFLRGLDKPVHIQVFVTPTCPYCPASVILAHQMAVAGPQVRADMIEAMEFPHLAIQYQVLGVPRTVINETVHIEGAAPEAMVLEGLQAALAEG